MVFAGTDRLSGLRSVILPPEVETVIVAADSDEAGEKAAQSAFAGVSSVPLTAAIQDEDGSVLLCPQGHKLGSCPNAKARDWA